MNKKELIMTIIEINSYLHGEYKAMEDEITEKVNELVDYPDLFEIDMEGIKEAYDDITDEATLFGFASKDPETVGDFVEYLILANPSTAISDTVDGNMVYNSDLWEWLGDGNNEQYIENYLREHGYNGESFFELVRLAHDDLLTDGLYSVIDDLRDAGIQKRF